VRFEPDRRACELDVDRHIALILIGCAFNATCCRGHEGGATFAQASLHSQQSRLARRPE
jgi:hypothetical protein